MLQIKTPSEYVNEPGILAEAGKYIKQYGDHALLIGGETALRAVGEDFYKSLKEHEITYEKHVFTGYPTIKQAKEYAEKAKKAKDSIIIGIGGGRVLDTAKSIGDFAGLPVVTVPTVAATCAAWAEVSITYDEEGDFEQFFRHPNSPKLILADPKVIATAPVRYLNAGIVDTMAKWYETVPGITGINDPLSLLISVHAARLAFDLLREKGIRAVEESILGQVTKNLVDVVDAILYLAGVVGSFVGEKAYSGFAHPFYHAARRIKGVRNKLHGEIVAFGLLTQLILEDKSDEIIKATIEEFAKYNELFTIEEIGLGGENQDENLKIVAERVIKEFPTVIDLGVADSARQIVEAFGKVDAYVKKYRAEIVLAK